MASNTKPSSTRPVIRVSIRLFIGLLVIGVSLAAIFLVFKYNAARKRAAWKQTALEQLGSMSATNEIIRAELDNLKDQPATNSDSKWVNDHVLLTTNGEYIIYNYRHGENSGWIVDHLFLGHCSDGRWIYSTYHFCNGMNMIRGEDAPGSITDFINRYAAREFDGKSDVCLQHTWP